MAKKRKDRKVCLTLIFDNKDARHQFVADWLDGGLDGGGNRDWDTDYKESDDWAAGDDCTMLRIKGTGEYIP